MKDQIIKKESSHNTITFVALVPDEEDRNGDIISKDEIIKTAHEFMINLQKKAVNVNHSDNSEVDGVEFVESFIAPVDIKVNDTDTIPAGSWLLAMKVSPELYTEIEDGAFSWISIEGRGIREQV